jgi:hypothetical protein
LRVRLNGDTLNSTSAGGVGAGRFFLHDHVLCMTTEVAFLRNYLSPLAVDRATNGRGHGAFAVAPIPARTVIATFGGEIHRRYSFDSCDPDRRARSIQIDDDLYVLGPPTRDPGDSINHSCAPNCGAGNAVQIVTMREIEPGEELTFDYAMTDGSDYDEFECLCGSNECRGTIRGSDWRRRSLHERYKGFVSPYLTRRVHSCLNARLLQKSDVETLMANYDSSPRKALTTALRSVLARPYAHWTSLVGALPIDPQQRERLYVCDQHACDLLLTELNELRGAPIIDSLQMCD